MNSGSITSGGGNLIGDGANAAGVAELDIVGTSESPADPLLDYLDYFGGQTQTIGLQEGSPAIDAAVAQSAPGKDQRGYSRSGSPDIGAFEFGGESNRAPIFSTGPTSNATSEEPYTGEITGSDEDDDPLVITASTLPSWLTLTDHGDGTATLAGTPTNANAGENEIVLNVSDGGGGAVAVIDQSQPIGLACSCRLRGDDRQNRLRRRPRHCIFKKAG